jgi:hypothetical protein
MKKRNKNSLREKTIGAIFVLTAFSFLLPLQAQAQTDQNSPQGDVVEAGLRLVTSPLPISLVTEPGTPISTDLKVKNGGTGEERLQVTLMKFKAYEASGKPQLLEREAGDDFLDWVHFSESTFTLAPNEWKTITATFNVPETASFGYYYAFVFSRSGEGTMLKERETAIVGGTAVLVLLEARVPNALRQVEVAEFSLDKKFYEFLPATFSVVLKNSGNVHVAPRGNIFIDQGTTHDVAILEINHEKGSLLPQSNRAFETTWEDGFPLYVDKIEDGKTVRDEDGNIVKTLKWDWNNASKLRFGKYTAKMLLIYDDGQRDIPIEGEVSFWVVPWRIILGMLALALFAFLGVRSTLQNIWRKIAKKNTVS